MNSYIRNLALLLVFSAAMVGGWTTTMHGAVTEKIPYARLVEKMVAWANGRA